MLLKYTVFLLTLRCLHLCIANNTDSEYEDYVDEDNSDGECTSDDIIDRFIAMFTPEDYEHNKNHVVYEFGSFEQSFDNLIRLKQFRENVTQKTQDFYNRLGIRFYENLMDMDVPHECRHALARIASAVNDGQRWALKFLDAMPRLGAGMLDLSFPRATGYDECLSIESPYEKEKPTIRGQYCGLNPDSIIRRDVSEITPELIERIQSYVNIDEIRLNKHFQDFARDFRAQDVNYYWKRKDLIKGLNYYKRYISHEPNIQTLCIPTNCKPKDISKVVTKLLYPITKFPIILHPECDYKGKPLTFTSFEKLSLLSLVALISLTLISTVIEYTPKKLLIRRTLLENTAIAIVVDNFNAQRNLRSIFNTKKDPKYKFFAGFRALMSFYVTMVHYHTTNFMSNNILHSVLPNMYLGYGATFLQGTLFMDSFMMMAAIGSYSDIKRNLTLLKGKFSLITYVAARYLVFLPAILGSIMISFLFRFIGDGPLWNTLGVILNGDCEHSYHMPLLMVANVIFPGRDNMSAYSYNTCAGITWYLSADFQIWLFAPLAFLVLYHWPKLGVYWNIFLIFSALMFTFVVIYVFGIKYYYEFSPEYEFEAYMLSMVFHYTSFWNYIPAYLIGFLMVNIIDDHPKAYLGGQIGELFLWFINISLTVFVFYWKSDFHYPDYKFDKFFGYELDVFIFSHKFLYLAGWCWVTYACATGRGGFVYNFLTCKLFTLISNVTLEIYLLHLFVISYRIGVSRESVTFTYYTMTTLVMFDFAVAYVMSVLFALFITRPFRNLLITYVKRVYSKEINEIITNVNNDNNNTIFNKTFNQSIDLQSIQTKL